VLAAFFVSKIASADWLNAGVGLNFVSGIILRSRVLGALDFVGQGLARFLSEPGKSNASAASCKPQELANALRRGDVLLVEGDSRFSTAIKYLTQSTWSHAALCVATATQLDDPRSGGLLLEADVVEGVRLVPVSLYAALHTRICRPVGLTAEEIDAVVDYARSRIGHHYDLKNIVDLARYVIRTPPVPARWRRRMLSIGSGDPTRAICSSLIAQAFQSIHYPILPDIVLAPAANPAGIDRYHEFLHIRHHSLYAPRDFDISPYFEIVKPTLVRGFDPHALKWLVEPERKK
jgi:hypothetical protein